jgi:hypothetical protein
MELHQYKSLLDQIKAINTSYKKINELTGENFNVFRILKVESSEVRMHSAFIAELLNPKGKHGQKDVFLQLFIKSFCFKDNEIDPSHCHIEVEKPIGFKSNNGTEGGRIDIIVTDTKQDKHIIIENKIYAEDQINQLVAYHNHSPDSDLIYLTLYGNEPNEKSSGALLSGTHFKCCSYKTDIINWLELCRKEVAVIPIIRESISQYINLIKYLTNQTLNHNMEEELTELLKNHIEPAFAIKNNLEKSLKKVSKEFGDSLKLECQKIGLNCYYKVDLTKNHTGIWISKESWKYVNIGFQFQNLDKEMLYGIITKSNPLAVSIPIKLKNQIRLLPNNLARQSEWWLWSRRVEEERGNWGKFQAWQEIINGNMKSYIMENVKYLLNLTDGIDL